MPTAGTWMPARVVSWSLAAWVVVMVGQGCIDSRCYQHKDCPAGKVCLEQSGRCVVPECTSNEECGAGRLCDHYVCVEGCLADEECGEGFRCIEARCTAYREQCNCPAAPDFCRPDMNPASITAGQKVCVSDYHAGGLALLFGSVNCSHCWALFQAAQETRNELVQAGFDLSLAFVHIQGVTVDSEDLASHMPWATEAVFFDRPDLDIWGQYNANWYHFVVTDRHGCIHAHFGPIAPEDLAASGADSIREAWVSSLSTECPGQTVEATPDAVLVEPVADVIEETLLEVPDVVAVPEVSDLTIADGPLDLVSDGSDAGDVPSDVPVDYGQFTPSEECQVEAAEPVGVGDLSPAFLCTDRNPSSPTFEAVVSGATLGELVWIAYFGSCT